MAKFADVELLMRHGADGVDIAVLGSSGKATIWTIEQNVGVVCWETGVELQRSKWLVLDSPYFIDKREL